MWGHTAAADIDKKRLGSKSDSCCQLLCRFVPVLWLHLAQRMSEDVNLVASLLRNKQKPSVCRAVAAYHCAAHKCLCRLETEHIVALHVQATSLLLTGPELLHWRVCCRCKCSCSCTSISSCIKGHTALLLPVKSRLIAYSRSLTGCTEETRC